MAASLVWNGATSSDWFTASNWTPAQVPTAADDALIDATATVLIAGAVPATFNSLQLGSAAGATAPLLRVAGSISSSGQMTIERGATLRQETTVLSTVGGLVVAPGGLLTHASNSSARSFVVNLSVTGDFDLQSGATVSVVGMGYAGGTATNGSGPGAGRGATGFCESTGGGAGHGGAGGNATTRNQSPGGPGYGSTLDPTDLGSGGGAAGDPGCGPHPDGGNGGGAVLLTIGNTATLNGLITADGDNGGAGAGGGSGGSINIKAGTLAGNGSVRANGGSSGNTSGGGAGGGRIALTASVASSYTGTVSAVAGTGGTNGAPGVTAIKVAPATDYDLIVDGRGVIPSTQTVIPSGLSGVANLSVSTVNLVGGTLSLSNDFILGTRANAVIGPLSVARDLVVPGTAFSGVLNGVVDVQRDVVVTSLGAGVLIGTFTVHRDVVVQNGATLSASSMSITNDLIVRNGAKLTHPANAASRQYRLMLTVGHDFDLQSGGVVDLMGVGYAGGTSRNGSGPGFGSGATGFCDSTGGGAGHGGVGGNAGTRNNSAGGIAYDSPANPIDLGSGGGAAGDPGCGGGPAGGSGGGALVMTVANLATLNGLINADGVSPGPGAGGGSGGTINIKADKFAGTMSVRANGGTGISHGGGGGGGRIALTGCDANLAVASVTGGPAASGNGGSGAAGSSSIVVPGACPSPPATPTSIAFTAVSGASLSASWSSATLATAYLLQVSTAADFSGPITSSSTAGTSASVTGLQTSTTYFARVQATNQFGASPFSSVISTMTPAVIDDEVNLNVPAGHTYVMAGTHSYTGGIAVHGTIQVAAFAQGAPGFLFLSAPSARIFSGGRILADAAGYAPATGPGAGETVPEQSGGGNGSGAAYGGNGGVGIRGGNIGPDGNIVFGGNAYGSIAQPSDLGSGGGGITSGANVVVQGGRGGGKLRIDVGVLRVDGRISADGESGQENGFWNDRAGGGSGGSVWITAQQLEGAGIISANGGAASPRGFKNGGGGSGGRIAIGYDASTYSGTIAARGGLGRQFGGAGTVVYGSELRIDNGITGATTPILSGSYAFERVAVGSHAIVEVAAGASVGVSNLFVRENSTFTNRGSLTATGVVVSSGAAVLRQIAGTLSAPRLEAATGGLLAYDGGVLSAQEAEAATGGRLSVNSPLELARLRVAPGGVVTHDPGDADFDLAVSQSMTVEFGGRVSADAVGHAPATGPGAGVTVTENFGGGRGSGGGYGGQGGAATQPGGQPYGSLAQPSDLGSGGGGITSGHNVVVVQGGRGGGKLRIDAQLLRVDGLISADGQTGEENGFWNDRAGGGSGGSILITARQLEGSGTIRANGGNSSPRSSFNGGGGGGGRIALYYTTLVGTQTLTVGGGRGGQDGSPGTILDNGVLYGTMSGSSATLAFSQMQERLAASQTLGETISTRLLDFAGAISTGVPAGTFGVAELRVVLVKTGPFANKGFFRGRYTLSIPAGESLSGDWEGMAFILANDPGRLFLKGVLKGRIQGTLDGALLESSPGSGTFDRLAASCRLIQVGNIMGASTMYVSGSGVVRESAEHPGTTLDFLQATQSGEVGGYYSTPIDIAFSFLRVNHVGNPYNGEGFFAANYDSPQGSGQGWAYAAVSGDSARLSGPFEQSLRGLMEGVLTLDSPRSLLLTLRNLDAGLPLQAEVTASLATAGNTPIGGVATVNIEVRNDGYAVAEGVTVIAVAPEKSSFLSASGEHRVYDVTHWREGQLAPKPFIRWDFVTIPARSSSKMSYQVRLPPGTPNSVQAGIDVRAITTAWADTVFANYQPGVTP
ncbi:MAG: fibronectin type III domain-containing protein [Elusimicrobiota bacterium]|nr:fibronectin type III domain-containing protein [Elusimicrobiota bacterium]